MKIICTNNRFFSKLTLGVKPRRGKTYVKLGKKIWTLKLNEWNRKGKKIKRKEVKEKKTKGKKVFVWIAKKWERMIMDKLLNIF